MQALVHIGEVGVHHAGGSLILRPSLLAMSRLGTPSEIVHTVAVVFGQGLSKAPTRFALKQQLRAALEVWQACAPEEADTDPVTGYFSERNNFVMGAADPADVIAVAQALLRHGVLGDPDARTQDEEPPKDDEYSPLFDCRKHAAFAMGHLSLGERDAWAMTMTGLRLAIEAKYPKPETPAEQSAKRAPSLTEYDETMAWFDKVQAAKGVH